MSQVGKVLSELLYGLEASAVAIVSSIVAIFVPHFLTMAEDDMKQIGDAFRLFIDDIGKGKPWGEALADMMTRDYNAVSDDGKQIAIDFAEAVAIALEKAGFLPQGK